MAKRRQHHRGDFSMIHIFQKDGEQITVPQHLRIEYYTPFRKRRYVVERNGDSCTNCRIDGDTLVSTIALSRTYIGTGPLCYTVTIYEPDASYPSGERAIPTPYQSDILLWRGKTSDGMGAYECAVLMSENALARLSDVIIEQPKAGDYLVFDGTCWVNTPKPTSVGNLFDYATQKWVLELLQEQAVSSLEFSLDKDGYLYIRVFDEQIQEDVLQEAKVRNALNAKQWDGHQFKHYLDQAVRKSDAVEFLRVAAKQFATTGFAPGLKGAAIDENGDAEFGALITRLCATLAELVVNGRSVFKGNLSSEEFVSGFLNGKGWSITKKEVQNAVGQTETKYVGEFDEVIVRGVMRIFSLVYSQLLGENDNRVFTSMMEVDHYDSTTGRVWLKTQDGKLYNSFRKGDYIMVQQYNGLPSEDNDHYITKHYEFIITDAGCGNQADGVNRLDWVTLSNFISADGRSAAEVITKGDTFVRVDSATDADRKGVIQIITVGAATPYMDIVYGMKTDPDNSLKGRIGNLEGVHHHLFGWLQGFGELLTNLYAVGDIRLKRTGESLDAKIEMLKGLFTTSYQRITYDMTEEDNYLQNATFTESMEGWSSGNDTTLVIMNEAPMLINGNTVQPIGRVASIEEYDGRNMLHIRNSYIRQANANIRKPGTHKVYNIDDTDVESEGYTEDRDTLYLTIKYLARTDGTLRVGFDQQSNIIGALPFTQVEVDKSLSWKTMQVYGTWDGKGDFIVEYSGDMYVAMLSITDRPLDEYKKETATKIEQTDSNIRLLATKVDNQQGSTTQLGVRLDAAEGNIEIYAEKISTLEDTTSNLGVRLDAAEGNIEIYAEKATNNESAITELEVRAEGIESTVAGVSDDLEAAKQTAEAASSAAQAVAETALANAGNAQNAAEDAQDTADDALKKAKANATAILQNESAISIIAARFDEDGNLLEGSGWVTTSKYQELYSQVNDAETGLSTKASISTSVQYDPTTKKITSDIKLAADNISLEGLVTANSYFKILTDGSIEVNKGTFNDVIILGSLAETPKSLPSGTSLDFSTGFNFAGYASANSSKTLNLPTDAKYNGVRCTITNTNNNGGYFIIKCSNSANFMYSSYNGTMLDVSTINLYGIGDVRLRAVLNSSGALRWFIENDGSFSYDWTNKKLTNGGVASGARLINIFKLKDGTLTKEFCSDNNPISGTSTADSSNVTITWNIKFSKSRSGHKKKYIPIATSDYSSVVGAMVSNITDAGFTVKAGAISLFGIDIVKAATLTVCIFEYS